MGIFRIYILILISTAFFLLSCKREKISTSTDILQLVSVKIGINYLSLESDNNDIPVDKSIIISFNSVLDTFTVAENVLLTGETAGEVISTLNYIDDFKTIVLDPLSELKNQENYTLKISNGIKGEKGESFPGITYIFRTIGGQLFIDAIRINGKNFNTTSPLLNINREQVNIEVKFSEALDASDYEAYFALSGGGHVNYSISQDSSRISVSNTTSLLGWYQYYFTISDNLTTPSGAVFNGFINSFYTRVDSSLKFPLISDDELLTLIQQQTFHYFYHFSHPVSGMTRERNTSGDVVTTGGSGFGIMALIVGIEREFISRSDGLSQLDKILGFLENCDRYHGAWPHWLNGSTGSTIPFSALDDGADLVETSFMVEGLLTMRQFLDTTITYEKNLVNRINTLCNGVEYDWFTRGENVLYWHWSPNNGWAMNMKIEGYNETLITYILAGSSNTHPVSADVYKMGFTRNGDIENGRSFYGYTLPLGADYGGPLFFTHYSFMGLDPRNLKDELASYWQQNVNHALINWAYCSTNPKGFPGYTAYSWGLTASDNPWGYSAHSPTNDLGVITPTAAISSIPYTPDQSIDAIRFFYYILGDKLWGEYGFYDAFDVKENWWADTYVAIDQGPIICMIENYRTGLLWDLFMSNPEVQSGLTKLGFTY